MRLISLSVLLTCFMLLNTGCSPTYNLRSIAGTNTRDLEQAKISGRTRTFEMSYTETYNKLLHVLDKNKLTVFQEKPKKGLIVFMGIDKQVDTTRIGVFLSPVSETSTEVTLSSLSSTALDKAETLIFRGLNN